MRTRAKARDYMLGRNVVAISCRGLKPASVLIRKEISRVAHPL